MSYLGTLTFEALMRFRLKVPQRSSARRTLEEVVQLRSRFFHDACAYYMSLSEVDLVTLVDLARGGWDLNAPQGPIWQLTRDGPYARAWDAYFDTLESPTGAVPGRTPWVVSLDHIAAFERVCAARKVPLGQTP